VSKPGVLAPAVRAAESDLLTAPGLRAKYPAAVVGYELLTQLLGGRLLPWSATAVLRQVNRINAVFFSQFRSDKAPGQLGTVQHRSVQQQCRWRPGLTADMELYWSARERESRRVSECTACHPMSLACGGG